MIQKKPTVSDLQSQQRRKIARRIVNAKTMEERRKWATKLSKHIDRDSGWVAPVSSKNKTFRQKNGGPNVTRVENVNPIESRRMIKRATRDLKQRTIGRLKEDNTTKAILRKHGALQPLHDNYQDSTTKTTATTPSSPTSLSSTLSSFLSPEPILSSPTKSNSLQRVLLEMQGNDKSALWKMEDSKTTNPPGTPLISNLNTARSISSTRGDSTSRSTQSSHSSRSTHSSHSSHSSTSTRSTRSSRSSRSSASIRSCTSSVSVAKDYDRPYLCLPELAGVTALPFSLRPGGHFYGQFLAPNGPCCSLLRQFNFPDTLVRMRLPNDAGTLKWIWLEKGQDDAVDVPYLDRPLMIQREHMLRRLSAKTTSRHANDPIAVLKVVRSTSSASSANNEHPGNNENNENDSEIGEIEENTNTTTTTITTVLYDYEDVCAVVSKIFSLNNEESIQLDDVVIIQKFVHARPIRKLASTAKSILKKKNVKKFKSKNNTGKKSKKKIILLENQDEEISLSDKPSVIRVISKCGFGKPILYVHEPKNIDVTKQQPGQILKSTGDSHYLVRKRYV